MESPCRLVSRGSPTARYAPARPHSDECGVHAVLDLARVTRKNVLLVGPDHRVADMVDFLVTDSMTGRRDGQRPVPTASSQLESVVVRDVDTLTPEEQQGMFAWLDSKSSRTQVVSTASAPLLPLVESGAFNEALYYRLNVVYVDLTG